MEPEPEFGDLEAPATKADVRTAMRFVMAEVRHLRTWAEGKFAVIDQRFDALEEKFKAVDQKFATQDQKMEKHFRKAVSTMTWRMVLADLAVVAAILGLEPR